MVWGNKSFLPLEPLHLPGPHWKRLTVQYQIQAGEGEALTALPSLAAASPGSQVINLQFHTAVKDEEYGATSVSAHCRALLTALPLPVPSLSSLPLHKEAFHPRSYTSRNYLALL